MLRPIGVATAAVQSWELCTLLLFGQITEFEYTRAVLCAKYADPLSSVYSTRDCEPRIHVRVRTSTAATDGRAGPTNAS